MDHGKIPFEYVRTVKGMSPALGGYRYSRLGGESNNRPDPLPVLPKKEILFYFDQPLGNRIQGLANGGFDRGPFLNPINPFPGWSQHGGGGPGHFRKYFGDGYLALDILGAWQRHNRFYIPDNAVAIQFDYRVNLDSPNDEFVVSVGNVSDEYPITSITNDRMGQIDISSLAGTVQTLKFEIVRGGLIIESEVWVDNVKLILDNTPVPVLPLTPTELTPPHEEVITTLTPSFTWSAFQHGGDGQSQAGFQCRVRSDTDGDIIVYDTGFIPNTSQSTHTYTPGAYTGTDPVTGEPRVSEPLEWSKHYHWHVRYQDSGGDWSQWSADDPNPHQDFFTADPPALTLAVPNGGETWRMGDTEQIQWSSTQSVLGDVKIDLYRNDTFERPITPSTSNSGSFDWDLPTDLTGDDDYKVKVSSINDPSVFGYSANTFTLLLPPLIAVTDPSGGETWTMGDNRTIDWTSRNISGNVKIELYQGGVLERSVAPDTEDDGAFSWPIPTDLSESSSYKVKVMSLDEPGVFGISNNPFTLVSPSPPNVTVSVPDGGETWQKGSNQTITWTDNFSENVKIELLKGGGVMETIAASTPSDGSHLWAVSAGLATGSDYRVRITHTVDAGVSSTSAGDFTIAESGPVMRYVATNGSDAGNNDCTNAANRCATLGHAVSKANAGDTIDIAAGSYPLVMSLLIDKALTIQGQGAIIGQ